MSVAKGIGVLWAFCRCVWRRGRNGPGPVRQRKHCRVPENKDSIIPGTASIPADGQRGRGCHPLSFFEYSRQFYRLLHLSKFLHRCCVLWSRLVMFFCRPRMMVTVINIYICDVPGLGTAATHTECLRSRNFNIVSRQTERRKETAALPLTLLTNCAVAEPVK